LSDDNNEDDIESN